MALHVVPLITSDRKQRRHEMTKAELIDAAMAVIDGPTKLAIVPAATAAAR